MLDYNLVNQNGNESLVVMLGGSPQSIPASHGNYRHIRDYLLAGGTNAEQIRDWLNASQWASRRLMRLSDRVSYEDGTILFDGDVIDTALSRHIVRKGGERQQVFPGVAEVFGDFG